jgi:hypothetical protein
MRFIGPQGIPAGGTTTGVITGTCTVSIRGMMLRLVQAASTGIPRLNRCQQIEAESAASADVAGARRGVSVATFDRSAITAELAMSSTVGSDLIIKSSNI